MDQYDTFLRKHISEFYHLTEEEWNFVSKLFTLKKLRKHQFLIQEGQKVEEEFLIVSGLVKSYEIDENGKEFIIQFAKENYWVSDYFAFQFHQPATMNVDCVEDCTFLALSFENREIICEKIHKMANFFRKKSNRGFIGLQQRVLSLMKETAEERYTQLLDKDPDLIQRVPKKMLAAFLGVSRETLSRF